MLRGLGTFVAPSGASVEPCPDRPGHGNQWHGATATTITRQAYAASDPQAMMHDGALGHRGARLTDVSGRRYAQRTGRAIQRRHDGPRSCVRPPGRAKRDRPCISHGDVLAWSEIRRTKPA